MNLNISKRVFFYIYIYNAKNFQIFIIFVEKLFIYFQELKILQNHYQIYSKILMKLIPNRGDV